MSLWDFGRRFTNSLPLVGGVSSALFGDPGHEDMQAAFQKAQQDLARNRMYNMDARMNAMNQSAMAFGPRNQMLGQMMGQQGPAMDLQSMMANPMPMAQQQDIRQAAFGNQVAPPPNGAPNMGMFDPRTVGPYRG